MTSLAGHVILVARARSGPSRVAAALRDRGASVLEWPHVERTVEDPPRALLAALDTSNGEAPFDAIVIASEEATLALRLAVQHRPGLSLPPLLAVSEEARAALGAAGFEASEDVAGACAVSLAALGPALDGRRVLVPVTAAGRPELLAELGALGARPDPVVFATDRHTFPALGGEDGARELAAIELVVLGASSAARALYGDGPSALRRIPAIAVGPKTEAAARELGVTAITLAPDDSREALVAAVEQHFTPRDAPASATASVPAPAPSGLLVVYTGNGKGKTTAALGMVFRALGRGLRVTVVQFIKGKWKTGERLFAETLPALRFHVMGRGFTWESDDLSRDKAAAEAAWATSKQEILSGERDLVVLDELTYTFHYGFLSLADVLETFRARPPHVHVVVTGRNAPEELVALADLVTEMALVKHPFAQGKKAQKGVDF